MIFIDTNIFIYAAGRPSPQKDPSARFLSQLLAAGSATECYTNTEVLQELLHRYRSIGCAAQGELLIDYILQLGITVLPVELEDIQLARALLREHSALSTRDGVHAAVMLRRSIGVVASFDRDFDLLSSLSRIEPR